MKKTVFKIIAIVLLIIGVLFVLFALNHPELSFPWDDVITYIIYVAYILLIVLFYLLGFRKKK